MAVHVQTPPFINEQMVLALIKNYTNSEEQIVISSEATLREFLSTLYSPTPTTESVVSPSASEARVSDGEMETDGETAETDEVPKRKEKKEKKAKREKDPDKPKKPLTPYLLYNDQYRSEVKADLELSSGEKPKPTNVMKALGIRWHSLTEEEKEPFQNKHEELKVAYVAEIDTYYTMYPERKPQKQQKAKKTKTMPSEKPITSVSHPKASPAPVLDASLPEIPEGWFGPYGGFLSKIPIDSETGKPISKHTFKSFDEAVERATELGEACGGITSTKSKYILRKARIISSNDSSQKKGEVSWCKVNSGESVMVQVPEVEASTAVSATDDETHQEDLVVDTPVSSSDTLSREDSSVSVSVSAIAIAMEAGETNDDEEDEDEDEEDTEVEVELEEFEFNGITYNVDPDNIAYLESDDGEITQVGKRIYVKLTGGHQVYEISLNSQ